MVLLPNYVKLTEKEHVLLKILQLNNRKIIPLGDHEFIYRALQGYDLVFMLYIGHDQDSIKQYQVSITSKGRKYLKVHKE